MATPSRTRVSVTAAGSRITTRSGHTSPQIKRFLKTIASVEMKRKPKSGVLGYRQSKNLSNFSSSFVGSSLCSYFRTDGLVNTVLVNHVAASRLKGHLQTCNDSRVVPPLGNPTAAVEKFFPKVDVLHIAHPIHPPKEPDKARRCQVPILYSPLKKARLHLEFLPHYMTFAMIVFNSYGSRRNILAHDVFDKRQKREIAQTVYPALSLHFPDWWFLKSLFLLINVQREIEIILVFQPTFLTGTFGWVRLCFVDSFVNMMGKTPKWIGNFFGREQSQGLHPRSFLCRPIPQLFCRDQPDLEYFQQLDWLHLHFRLGNPSVGQQVLSPETMFDAKAKLMALAHHEQQNGLSLSSKDLQDSGIRKSFGFIPFTNLHLIIAVCSALPFFGYIQHTKTSVPISLFDILLGEICQHMRILNAFSFKLDSTDWGIHFDNFDPIDRLQQTALQTSRFTARGSMVCSTIWNTILTLMGHSYFSTFMNGLTSDLHADFVLWFTSILDLWPVWDPGDALTTVIKLMLSSKFQENHFKVHPHFLVLQLHPINPALHSTCLQPQRLATRIGIIQHKSWPFHLTVQSQYMRYCSCFNLSTDYVVCMTALHGFFHDLELCIYDHELYHISIVGVCPFAATHVIPPLQRLLGLVLITDPMVILTAFDKHFTVERDYKTLDSFNTNGLLPLHDLIEMASTAFGLNASEMISPVHLEGLLGHAQGSIGLQVWGNDGSHGLAGKIPILGTASMTEEPAMLFIEPIKQAQRSMHYLLPSLMQ